MSTAGARILAGLTDALAYAHGETARGSLHRVQVPAPVEDPDGETDTDAGEETKEQAGVTEAAPA